MCLLLSWSIQWKEVATSTARNFNSSWPLYLYFSNMINLCLSIWFNKNWKCQQVYFERRAAKKLSQIFDFLKGRCFVIGGSINMNVSVFWETSVVFPKSVVLQLFPEYTQSYANLNSKVGQNSTALNKYAGCFSVFHLDMTCRTL